MSAVVSNFQVFFYLYLSTPVLYDTSFCFGEISFVNNKGVIKTQEDDKIKLQ